MSLSVHEPYIKRCYELAISAGKKGFDTFSHHKSIMDKKTWIDLPMRYQPYKTLYGKLLHMFLK